MIARCDGLGVIVTTPRMGEFPRGIARRSYSTFVLDVFPRRFLLDALRPPRFHRPGWQAQWLELRCRNGERRPFREGLEERLHDLGIELHALSFLQHAHRDRKSTRLNSSH